MILINNEKNEADGLNYKSTEWLRKNTDKVDRVLYHMGNSHFHIESFNLIKEVPGVVVLHDFFLSDVLNYMETAGIKKKAFQKALYYSHSYKALSSFSKDNIKTTIKRYPANLEIIQNSLGIIGHSKQIAELIELFYNTKVDREFYRHIPLARKLSGSFNKKEAKKKLGFKEDDFIIGSFGFLDPIKMNLEVLRAFLASSYSKKENYHLIFAGESFSGLYKKELKALINNRENIRISNWLSDKDYESCLKATDLAIQLRRYSKRESSAAILDCMNYGIAVIANKTGSTAELPRDCLYFLDSNFKEEELTEAIDYLIENKGIREKTGENARKHISLNHGILRCAGLYHESIESFYLKRKITAGSLIPHIAEFNFKDDEKFKKVSSSIAYSFPPEPRQKNLFIDISHTSKNDLKTGIERVAKALILELMDNPPRGWRVEPVYLDQSEGNWHYRFASNFTLKLLEADKKISMEERRAKIFPGDMILGLDLAVDDFNKASEQGFFQELKILNVKVFFMIHDILPLKIPEFFPPGMDKIFEKWLYNISMLDGVICVSKSSKEDLKNWLEKKELLRPDFKLSFSHNGADIKEVSDKKSSYDVLGEKAEEALKKIEDRLSFIMVGTIEPRKAHLQVLRAFDLLWKKGRKLKLIIIGQEGWKGLEGKKRRNLDCTIKKLREYEKQREDFFWLEGLDDSYLESFYKKADCLIAASIDEGFGLPLIEAARRKLPLIIRDTAIFREVAGENAFYFKGETAEELAGAIEIWLDLYKEKKQSDSSLILWKSWKESAENLKSVLFP